MPQRKVHQFKAWRRGRRQLSIIPSLMVLLSSLPMALVGQVPGLTTRVPTTMTMPTVQSTSNSILIASLPRLNSVSTAQSLEAQSLERQGRDYYQMGQYQPAVKVWQAAYEHYVAQQQVIEQARVQSNLALAYQQLGQWPAAHQAIAHSLALLASPGLTGEIDRGLAQALNTQGSLQFATGQLIAASQTWQQAVAAYQASGDALGTLRAQINQAEAFKALGFFRRARQLLTQVNDSLKEQPDSELKAAGLRSYGDNLRQVGNFAAAESVLQRSLAIAQQRNLLTEASNAQLSLGNLAQAQGNEEAAQNYYQAALVPGIPPVLSSQIQLAQLNLARSQQAWSMVRTTWPLLQDQLAALPLSHQTLYRRLQLAEALIQLRPDRFPKSTMAEGMPHWETVTQWLEGTLEQAREFNDSRSAAYSLGYLGHVSELRQQWTQARQLTEQALLIAQHSNAPESIYRWQWQLGRIFQAIGQTVSAKDAYYGAYLTLQSLRQDLVVISQDIQFSFRDEVEPIYRTLVNLLLQPGDDGLVPTNHLMQARQVMENLQLAELENFLREACTQANPMDIDDGTFDPLAAVIYPVILSDRLAIIASLPIPSEDGPVTRQLIYRSIPVNREQIEQTVQQLRRTLVIRSRRQFRGPSSQLYDWLMRPLTEVLARTDVQTLVFVLDGALRNIPMSTLYDQQNQQFLIEQYAIALTPGLQLVDSQPLRQLQLSTSFAGLTEARAGFAPLSYVEQELANIQAVAKSDILLDQMFTRQAWREQIQFKAAPIVHVATHGQFSSKLEQTFILAWDGQINISQLEDILESRMLSQKQGIELLVLSACETASGDNRATLGLAGIAVRSGARSTLATLWPVNDQGTAEIMGKFYQELQQPQISKAQALRQAQLQLIENGYLRYGHPFYWAPYVLVGNWR